MMKYIWLTYKGVTWPAYCMICPRCDTIIYIYICYAVTWYISNRTHASFYYFCQPTVHGPLTRYAKLRVGHAQGMPGTFYPRVSDPDMHHGMCVPHVRWCMPGLLTSGFLWSRWRRKRSRHARCMHSPQFCVTGSLAEYVTAYRLLSRGSVEALSCWVYFWNHGNISSSALK